MSEICKNGVDGCDGNVCLKCEREQYLRLISDQDREITRLKRELERALSALKDLRDNIDSMSRGIPIREPLRSAMVNADVAIGKAAPNRGDEGREEGK